jgi:C4-dicarboxylate-specific signal transduction histidine kinase
MALPLSVAPFRVIASVSAAISPSRDLLNSVDWRWWVVMYTVTLLGVLFALARLSMRERARHQALDQKEAEQQRMMAESQRQRDTISHMNRVAALGELATSLAHEINQPLGAILVNAEAALQILKRPRPDLAEVREALADILEDGQRAGMVIRKMRTMLRPGEYQPEAVDLNALVKEVLLLVMNDASLRSIMISLDLAPGLPLVFSDSVQLQQVILNLVTNGMDAMSVFPVTDRTLMIRSYGAAGGRDVVLEVEDSGPGIPPSDFSRIFEPFFTTKVQGLGMGLSISRSIVEVSGGKIWVENGVRGAVFKVRLKATEVGEETAVLSQKTA